MNAKINEVKTTILNAKTFANPSKKALLTLTKSEINELYSDMATDVNGMCDKANRMSRDAKSACESTDEFKKLYAEYEVAFKNRNAYVDTYNKTMAEYNDNINKIYDEIHKSIHTKHDSGEVCVNVTDEVMRAMSAKEEAYNAVSEETKRKMNEVKEQMATYDAILSRAKRDLNDYNKSFRNEIDKIGSEIERQKKLLKSIGKFYSENHDKFAD